MVHPVHVRRGLSDQGIGEGPGAPISYGEQFLHADAPAAQDGELLRALRPWMALDLPARVQEDYQERLEGWSIVELGQRVYVTRLGWAPPFDRRQAYFSHAMGWPAEMSGDPGALLGRTEAFEASWSGSPPRTPTPELSRFSLPWALSEHQAAAQVLLAHMLASASSGAALILATRRYGSFTVGSPLTGLVAFCRAALPAELRRGYNVRLPAGQPELYLTPGKACARLIGIHQDDAVSAIRAAERLGKGVLLLEIEPGELPQRRHGDAPDDAFAAYAKHFVTQAAGSEDVLAALPALTQLADTARGRDLSARWLHTDEGQRWLRSIRNMAFLAVAGQDTERLHGLFTRFLAKVDKQPAARTALLPWERVVQPATARALSPDTLIELVFSNSDGPGSLGDWSLRLAAQLGIQVDAQSLRPRLDALSADEAAARIVALVEQRLVPLEDVVRLYAPERLWDLQDDALAARLLAFEHQAGVLRDRAGELGPLTALALRRGDVFQTLLAETLGGGLPPEWLEPALRQATLSTGELEGLLLKVADYARPGARWRLVAGELVRLLWQRRGGSVALLHPLDKMASALVAGDIQDLERALDALSLMEQIQPGHGAMQAQGVLRTEDLEGFGEEKRALVLQRLQSGALSVHEFAVFNGDWHLPARWVANGAEWLSQDAALLGALSVDALMALSPLRSPPPGPPAQHAVVGELDRRMRGDESARTRCVSALTRLDSFHLWLRGTQLPTDALRAALVTWLSWPDQNAQLASQASWDEPIARLEALKKAEASSGLTLFEAAAVLSRREGPRWSKLHGFPGHQLQGFLRCVWDREALCMVAELQQRGQVEVPQGATGVGWLLAYAPRERPLSPRMMETLTAQRVDTLKPDRDWLREANGLILAEDIAVWRKLPLLSYVVAGTVDRLSSERLLGKPLAERQDYMRRWLNFLVEVLQTVRAQARAGSGELQDWEGPPQRIEEALKSAERQVGQVCRRLLGADAGVLPPDAGRDVRAALLSDIVKVLSKLDQLADAQALALIGTALRALSETRRPPPHVPLTTRGGGGSEYELQRLLGDGALRALDDALVIVARRELLSEKGVDARWGREAANLGWSALAHFLAPPTPGRIPMGQEQRGYGIASGVQAAPSNLQPAVRWAWSLLRYRHAEVKESLQEASATMGSGGQHPIDALVQALRRLAHEHSYGPQSPNAAMHNLRATGRGALNTALQNLPDPLGVLQATPGSSPDLPFFRLYAIVGRARSEGHAVALVELPETLAESPHARLLQDPRWWEGLLRAVSTVEPLPGDSLGTPFDARARLHLAVLGGERAKLQPLEIQRAFAAAWRRVPARDPVGGPS